MYFYKISNLLLQCYDHMGIRIINRCLPVFLVNYMSGFDYYKQDQTRNHEACCAIFYPENA